MIDRNMRYFGFVKDYYININYLWYLRWIVYIVYEFLLKGNVFWILIFLENIRLVKLNNKI